MSKRTYTDGFGREIVSRDDTVTLDGREFKVSSTFPKGTYKDRCRLCDLRKTPIACGIAFCAPYEREDGLSAVFTEVKQQTK